jgi:hypothetical protein
VGVMRAQLYLLNNFRRDMKKDFLYIRELYFEKINRVFANAEVNAYYGVPEPPFRL